MRKLAAALVVSALVLCAGSAQAAPKPHKPHPNDAALVGSSLTIVEGSGPFTRDQIIHFDATWTTPTGCSTLGQGRDPWVEVDIALADPGAPGAYVVPLVAVYRDYEAPFEIVLGDQGGTSLWGEAGYPSVVARAALFCYSEDPATGADTGVALFAITDPFGIEP